MLLLMWLCQLVLVFASIPIPNEANPPSIIVDDRILWLALAKTMRLLEVGKSQYHIMGFLCFK
jgi:hypothetical protein